MDNKEVLAELKFILGQIPHKYLKKIPKEILDYINTNYDINYYSKYDLDKTFYNYEFKNETKEILKSITGIYWD